MDKINEITKEELTNGFEFFLTVGKLKEFLNENNLPDDAKVVVQRVEDVYFKKHNWGVYLKEGEHTFKDEKGNIDKSSMEQYFPVWCCANYKDEKDVLFIHAHY